MENETNKETIKVMVQSLGGNQILAMTGGSFMANYEDCLLYFKYKGSKHSNCLTIAYNAGLDLFNLKFRKIWGMAIKEIEEINGVYADQVKSIFENTTKLFTSL